MNESTVNNPILKENESTRAILAGVDTGEYDAEISMDELEELAETAGAVTVCRIIQKRPAIESATILGEGKIEELSAAAKDLDAQLIIFDMELSSSQIRNIEDITSVRVIDRTMLILDIFAGRAVTNEGKLQVELAQLKYRLPRLMGIGTSLSRLGGGIGTKGPGETQLETDRRHIRRRIDKLSDELKELEKRRDLSRRRRKKDSVCVGAIVGYTNGGLHQRRKIDPAQRTYRRRCSCGGQAVRNAGSYIKGNRTARRKKSYACRYRRAYKTASSPPCRSVQVNA